MLPKYPGGQWKSYICADLSKWCERHTCPKRRRGRCGVPINDVEDSDTSNRADSPAVQRRPVAGARWAIPRRIHGARLPITSTARSERRIAVRRPGVGIDASSASCDPARGPWRSTASSSQVPGTPRSSTLPRSSKPDPGLIEPHDATERGELLEEGLVLGHGPEDLHLADHRRDEDELDRPVADHLIRQAEITAPCVQRFRHGMSVLLSSATTPELRAQLRAAGWSAPRRRPQSERPRSHTRGCCWKLRCVAVSVRFGDFGFKIPREVAVVSLL